MARDNYSYKKYQRELTKKKKKEAKIQRKLDKKNQPAEDLLQASGETAPETLAPGAGEALPDGTQQPGAGV